MMKLHHTGKNIDVTQALKSFTEEKLNKLAKKFSHISNVYIVYTVENATQIAEATVHIDGFEIHASADTQDMYQSIEAMIDKLNTQLIRHKEKLISDHQN